LPFSYFFLSPFFPSPRLPNKCPPLVRTSHPLDPSSLFPPSPLLVFVSFFHSSVSFRVKVSPPPQSMYLYPFRAPLQSLENQRLLLTGHKFLRPKKVGGASSILPSPPFCHSFRIKNSRHLTIYLRMDLVPRRPTSHDFPHLPFFATRSID